MKKYFLYSLFLLWSSTMLAQSQYTKRQARRERVSVGVIGGVANMFERNTMDCYGVSLLYLKHVYHDFSFNYHPSKSETALNKKCLNYHVGYRFPVGRVGIIPMYGLSYCSVASPRDMNYQHGLRSDPGLVLDYHSVLPEKGLPGVKSQIGVTLHNVYIGVGVYF